MEEAAQARARFPSFPTTKTKRLAQRPCFLDDLELVARVTPSPLLLWFRQDLRLSDNSALQAALKRGGPIIPLYILDDEGEGEWVAGGASRWWLHRSLSALKASLSEINSTLVVRRGDSLSVVRELLEQTGATAVYWNRRCEPAILRRDAALQADLRERGIEAENFNSALLFEPSTVKNKQGGPFQVFTPFWRHCLSQSVAEPVGRAVKKLPAPTSWPRSLAIDELGLLPSIRWDAGLEATWSPGEAAAGRQLKKFLKLVENYAEQRDQPAADASSRLSPYLHFGELGPRQIWSAIKSLSRRSGVFPVHPGAQKYLAELGWREFAYHLLYYFPDTPKVPLRAAFSRFPWADDPAGRLFKKWRTGQTGYPIVDAGMRNLWKTGWMPNRVRMIVASFLVKHLRLPWQAGAAWFWDTLVDADLANNTLGWQWIAGSGADASPYFRIFAPVLQGQKFDPDGHYVHRWVPELAKLPNKYVHAPWEAPAEVLERADVKLGVNYPAPMVDHGPARAAALAAYRTLKQ